MNIRQAKASVFLPDLLARLGRQPSGEKNGELWYHSPLREGDSSPSFKTDPTGRLWFDHGTGEGGDVVKFARLYWQCGLGEALRHLTSLYPGSLFDVPPAVQPTSKSRPVPLFDWQPGKVDAEMRSDVDIRPITSRGLYWYLHHRGIDPQLAKPYVKEMRHQANGSTFYALAFPSDQGGYELRNGVGVTEGKPGFKGVHGPKAISVLHPEKATEGGSITVFEGFFDFLTALAYYGKEAPDTPVIVMNSTAMHAQTADAIRRLQGGRVYLYLDHDATGQEAVEKLSEALTGITVEDRSQLYAAYTDFNEFWMREGKQAKADRGANTAVSP